MRHKIGAMLAALAIALGIAVAPASPAMAATYHSCEGGTVCLYQWVNFTGPEGPSKRYQVALSSIWHDPTGCWDILAWWPNNTIIRGNSWSYVVNHTASSYQGNDWRFHFYTGANCTGTDGAVSMAYETEASSIGGVFHAHSPGIYSFSISLVV